MSCKVNFDVISSGVCGMVATGIDSSASALKCQLMELFHREDPSEKNV